MSRAGNKSPTGSCCCRRCCCRSQFKELLRSLLLLPPLLLFSLSRTAVARLSLQGRVTCLFCHPTIDGSDARREEKQQEITRNTGMPPTDSSGSRAFFAHLPITQSLGRLCLARHRRKRSQCHRDANGSRQEIRLIHLDAEDAKTESFSWLFSPKYLRAVAA